MPLFATSKSYLGVDIGSASVKMVELSSVSGRPRLVTYGYAELPVDIFRAESEEGLSRIVTLIKKIYQEAHCSATKTVAALPSYSVFSSIISLPILKKKEIAQAIQWEAKKFVPMPVDEMVLDWKLVKSDHEGGKNQGATPSTGVKGGSITTFSAEQQKETTLPPVSGPASQPVGANFQRVLITAAPKNLVDRYLKIFQETELQLMSIETESYALERSLVGHDPAPVMIVDIGAISSDMCIVEDGLPVLTRSIDIGGITITNAIMHSLNIDIRRAEQFKRDIGFDAQGGGDIPKTIVTTINPIINEIKYAFDLYASQGSVAAQVAKVILTGGSSYLPHVGEYLGRLLDIKVVIGDPWARVMYPLELKPVLMELGPRFSVAIGLAMREIT